MSKETVVNVASITKMFTAATILRMIEINEYKEIFPHGVDTKISDLEDILRNKYPENSEFFKYLKEQEQYEDVTLRHLLQHTHGLGSRTPACFEDILADPQKLWEAPEALNPVYLKADTTKGRFGEYKYSNTGYDLLGAIIEATASHAKGEEASYCSMVKELVIKPLELENTYTYEDKIPESITIEHGHIKNQETGEIESDCPDRYTFAAGMIRSTPSDIAKKEPGREI
ncbi:beta-lactamase family protein [Rickettsiales bacterium]|nr:beta-lactamase family protein [Rickettsiales bacterium]